MMQGDIDELLKDSKYAPRELARNMELIRHIDQKCQSLFLTKT